MTALEISPQYIIDNSGNRVSVVLSIKAFQEIVEMLEELEDIRLYDEVMSRNEERVSLEDYLAERKSRAKEVYN